MNLGFDSPASEPMDDTSGQGSQDDLPTVIADLERLVRYSFAEMLAGVQDQEQVVQKGLEQLFKELDNITRQAGDAVQATEAAVSPSTRSDAPQQPVTSFTPPAQGADDSWDEVVFGPELAFFDSVAKQRGRLISQLKSGDPAAMDLVGQILIYRAAPTDRMPPLLKDVGEAYYRWQRKGSAVDDPLRDALTAWLAASCQQAGLGNTIELVYPGDRFDSARHNAKKRGVEVEDVLGWVVLRDNGKVYTKAAVILK